MIFCISWHNGLNWIVVICLEFICLGFYTVKNPSFARKSSLRFIVAEKQVVLCSQRNNSIVIPCNWEQKWLFSFWLPAELSELVISAEGGVSCAHHPSVFTLQLPIFHLILCTECVGQGDSRVVFSVIIILHNLQFSNLGFFQLLAFNERCGLFLMTLEVWTNKINYQGKHILCVNR